MACLFVELGDLQPSQPSLVTQGKEGGDNAASLRVRAQRLQNGTPPGSEEITGGKRGGSDPPFPQAVFFWWKGGRARREGSLEEPLSLSATWNPWTNRLKPGSTPAMQSCVCNVSNPDK